MAKSKNQIREIARRTPVTTLRWHAEPVDAVLARFGSKASGLSAAEAKTRLRQHGPNLLPPPRRRGPLLRLLLQFHSPLIYVLLAAAATTLLLEHYTDASVIFGVVIINTVIGFIQEGKAEAALEAVRAMLASRAMVLRDGERHEIDAADLVPGDIVMLESGSRVPADLRLLRVKNLRVNEAALTGESVPVEKAVEVVAAEAALGDRSNMAYSGTVVTFGQAHGVVVATGAATEIGRIGAMVADVSSLATPLTCRLQYFASQITVFILAVGVFTYLFGRYVRNMPSFDIFLAVIGLAVAAIPEGLPAIVTITLAICARIMAQHKAIVRRLPAVESLGSVTVICSDKTGTLTRNEMAVVSLMLAGRTLRVSGTSYAPEGGFHDAEVALQPSEDAELQALAQCALLCNDARLYYSEAGGWQLVGDPTEGALITLALKAGLNRDELIAAMPRIDEVPFASEHRFMATLHHDHLGHVWLFLKGAPERVLDLCMQDMQGRPLGRVTWEARMNEAAALGQRVLALARCELPAGTTALDMADITQRFTLLGLVGMLDPPSEEAIAAVSECRHAGIRVIMITGDHVATAAAIGRELGLNANHPLTGEAIEMLDDAALGRRLRETDVIARASPEHKLRLVTALKAQGELVAMTGDGVNDAPALKAADIGVAMGRRGTDAAKEAADLVLTDDSFATIAHAVREGRTVYNNIKKSLLFILPTNGGQSGVILLAVLTGMALPITAGQILWVNMVTAVTLALALAFEPAEARVMFHPPRPPAEPLLTRAMLWRIGYVSLLLAGTVFFVFEWELARGSSLNAARTAAVNTLVMGQIAYLFNSRHFTANLNWRSTLFGNPLAVWASLLLVILQLLFTYSSFMQKIFHTAPLSASTWGVILSLAVALFWLVAAEKWLMRRMGIRRM